MSQGSGEKSQTGRYELLEIVAESAEARTYRARDRQTGEEIMLEVARRGTPRRTAQPAPAPQPPPAYVVPQLAPRGVHPGTTVAIILAVMMAGMIGFFAGRSWTGLPSRPPAQTGDTTQPRPKNSGDPVGDNGGKTDTPPERLDAEALAAEALKLAHRQWGVFRTRKDYAGAIGEFEQIIVEHAGTKASVEAGKQVGLIQREWGQNCEELKDYAGARAHYLAAAGSLPAEDRLGLLARQKIPQTMAAEAGIAHKAKDYEDAVRLLAEATEHQFAAAKDIAVWQLRIADILAKDLEEWDRALAILAKMKESDTEAAALAVRRQPEVYAAAARHALTAKQYAQARIYTAALRSDYPDHTLVKTVRDIDAEALYRLLVAAPRGAAKIRDPLYDEIFRIHGDTSWSDAALRHRIGYVEGSSTLPVITSRGHLTKAHERFAENSYSKAIEGLKSVVKLGGQDTPPSQDALRLLPEWHLIAAARLCGMGQRAQSLVFLRQVLRLVPHTDASRRAQAMIQAIGAPPEGMAYVAAGSFTMGSSINQVISQLRTAGFPLDATSTTLTEHISQMEMLKETPEHIAKTKAFFIDIHEVTNAQYGEFVTRQKHRVPKSWEGKGEAFLKKIAGLPVTGVSLDDAKAYAKWRGMRLPTEIEWEKAARGRLGHIYPWGSKWTPANCNHRGNVTELDGARRPGSFPKGISLYGCHDMIGNVAEWTTSAPAVYPGSMWKPTDKEAEMVVIRGGDWAWQGFTAFAHSAGRALEAPAARNEFIGFRCVKDVEDAAPKPADD